MIHIQTSLDRDFIKKDKSQIIDKILKKSILVSSLFLYNSLFINKLIFKSMLVSNSQ